MALRCSRHPLGLQRIRGRNEAELCFVLFVPQYKTEEILLQYVKELGVVVITGIRVESVEPFAESAMIHGVSVSSDGSTNGTPFKAKGKFVIGADGVRSTVRTSTGIAFPGSPATHTAITGEVTLGVPMPNPYIAHNSSGLIICAQLKTPSGRARLGVYTPSRAHVSESTPVTLEDFNQALKEVAGIDHKLSNPCMLRRFHNEARCAEVYRKHGHIFLAGDAAHQHLPAGGQGLDLGLQDAFNLGWKLAAVIRGYGPDSLLDTYEAERRPIALDVVENTTAQSLLFFASTRPEWAIRAAMNKMLQVPEANRALAEQISCLGVSYPKPLDMIIPSGWELLPEAVAGKRALDVKFSLGNGEEKYLSEFTRSGKWVQIRFIEKLRGKPPTPAFDGMTEMVDVRDILEGVTSLYRCGYCEILIRPDCYLGFGRR